MEVVENGGVDCLNVSVLVELEKVDGRRSLQLSSSLGLMILLPSLYLESRVRWNDGRNEEFKLQGKDVEFFGRNLEIC